MRDGSDAIADWPLLNALLNTASGLPGVDTQWRGRGDWIFATRGKVTSRTVQRDGARIERVLTNDRG